MRNMSVKSNIIHRYRLNSLPVVEKKIYIYPLKVMLQFIHIYHIHVPDFKLFYVNWYNMNVAHKYKK